jgi:hypothetical protein
MNGRIRSLKPKLRPADSVAIARPRVLSELPLSDRYSTFTFSPTLELASSPIHRRIKRVTRRLYASLSILPIRTLDKNPHKHAFSDLEISATMTNLPPVEPSAVDKPIVISDNEEQQNPPQSEGTSTSGNESTNQSNGVQVFGAPETSTYVPPCKPSSLPLFPHPNTIPLPQQTSQNHTSRQQPRT